jgi:hypothetical protein
LEEEVVACLLGGHGIPAEVGNAAFLRLRDRGLFQSTSSSCDLISDYLKEPLTIGDRKVTYRFWSQKSRYIAAALNNLRAHIVPVESSLLLRDYLMGLPGIGPKTASWIVRNWLGSNEVAILDIHVIRAGLLMNLFSPVDKVERDYLRMEQRFLALVGALDVKAANLDALLWDQMRSTPHVVGNCLTACNTRPLDHSVPHVVQRQSRQSRLVLNRMED